MYWKPAIDFNPEDYVTEQVFYKSKDGTKVPMYIVYKKGLERNGKNPTYLYAYGGFNISLTPRFRISTAVWLDNGGVFAQPNLRGGGEYGEEWHIANINQVNGVNEPMIQWWINFRKSRLELHGEDGDEHGLMWKIFEWKKIKS